MGNRLHTFTTGGYYHIYNRGVEKRTIFLDPTDYQRFLERLAFYQQMKQLVQFSQSGFTLTDRQPPFRFELICYALMPNHFHLLLRASSDNGIPKSLAQLLNSHTKYFNKRYERVGPLFQGVYQSVVIQSDEQLLQVVRYILLNPYVAKLEAQLGDYPWTSYREHLGQRQGLCDQTLLRNYFESTQHLQAFLADYAAYARKVSELKHLTLD